MKNKLYFQNRHDHLKLIGENIEENEVAKAISDYVKSVNHNFKIYYVRSWASENNGNKIIYDVGSHNEFFVLEKEE